MAHVQAAEKKKDLHYAKLLTCFRKLQGKMVAAKQAYEKALADPVLQQSNDLSTKSDENLQQIAAMKKKYENDMQFLQDDLNSMGQEMAKLRMQIPGPQQRAEDTAAMSTHALTSNPSSDEDAIEHSQGETATMGNETTG